MKAVHCSFFPPPPFSSLTAHRKEKITKYQKIVAVLIRQEVVNLGGPTNSCLLFFLPQEIKPIYSSYTAIIGNSGKSNKREMDSQFGWAAALSSLVRASSRKKAEFGRVLEIARAKFAIGKLRRNLRLMRISALQTLGLKILSFCM